MTFLNRQAPVSSYVGLAMALGILGVATVMGKFVVPILYYVAEHQAGRAIPDVPVLWDFWWPVYMILAYALVSRARRARSFFIALGIARALWAIVTLTLFFAHPEWSFWRLVWLFCEFSALVVMLIGLIITLYAVAREDAQLRSATVVTS